MGLIDYDWQKLKFNISESIKLERLHLNKINIKSTGQKMEEIKKSKNQNNTKLREKVMVVSDAGVKYQIEVKSKNGFKNTGNITNTTYS